MSTPSERLLALGTAQDEFLMAKHQLFIMAKRVGVDNLPRALEEPFRRAVIAEKQFLSAQRASVND
jgi:hypothetical protein